MRCIAVAALLLLATPTFAKEKDPAVLAATHGFLYAGFSKGQGTVIAVELAKGGKTTLIETQVEAEPISGAQALGTWLPPGQYRMVGWNSWNSNSWKDGPTFEIQAGRITTLGDFAPVEVGGYLTVLLPINHAENSVGLSTLSQRMAGYLKDATPLYAYPTQLPPPVVQGMPGMPGQGIVASLVGTAVAQSNRTPTLEQLKTERDPVRFLQLWRSLLPPSFNEAAITADGVAYLGADLGQVRKRSAEGVWSRIGSDTVRAITAVEAADGRLITGSDNGVLRATRDEGASWSELHRFDPRETIVDIDHADGVWVVTTRARFKDPSRKRGLLPPNALSATVRVYVGHSDALNDLSLSKQVELTPVDLSYAMSPSGDIVNGSYYVPITPRMHRLTLATGEWKDITGTHKIGLSHVDPDSEVVTVVGDAGVATKLSMSSQRGDRWIPLERPSYIIHDIQMDTPSEGWALRFNPGFAKGAYELYSYAPERNDWTLTANSPTQCRPMRMSKRLPVICVTADARILSQHGKHWKTEFDTQAAGK